MRWQADEDRTTVKETKDAIFARTIELDDLKAHFAELEDENREKRRQLKQERDDRLLPLREEVFTLRAALKNGPEPVQPKAQEAEATKTNGDS